jgi:RNA 3'-terminal phosphate cyclase
VLRPGYPPSGGGTTACVIDEIAQQTIRSATQSKAVRPGEQ